MATKTRRQRTPRSMHTPAQILIAAAHRWKVPVWALVGVKLMESGNSTSNNPFQFELGTARSAGVGNVDNFAEAANGAARLLHEYHRKFGSWNAAFEAYNGGPAAVDGGYAYTEADVKAKLNEFGVGKLASKTQFASFGGRLLEELINPLFGPLLFPGDKGPVQKGAEAGAEAAGGLGAGLEAVGQFFGMLLTLEFWLRFGEALAGAILVYMGLKTLTGTGASDLPGAGAVRRAVPGVA